MYVHVLIAWENLKMYFQNMKMYVHVSIAWENLKMYVHVLIA